MSGFERWGAATERALYGRAGFYRRETPASHFTTSARTPVFAEAIARVADEVDERLGRPEGFTVVDVGAGGGDLLADLAGLLDRRISLVGVELRPRPAGLPERIAWRPEPPDRVSGLIVACELLDNVPCDVAVLDPEGRARYEEVDAEGRTRLGETLEAEDEQWIDKWWPLTVPGDRAEIGRTRDAAWADLTARLDRGTALAVDYGHTRSDRPQGGTLTGFAHGRQTEPIPDGARDVTAHVAVDAIACDSFQRQRDALHALGFTATRPPMALAYRNPTAYALALAKTTATARLTDPAGLGGHWWLRTDRP
ncbi:SAM-dependent methyltransferase [Glycomyces sp. NPDC046736]|uniref:SAM-dependent methyltransferase n=1 Tax=Glycomyces sp. NPDC046736 TaxID=3155615 RepID=UPI0034115F9E